MKEKIKYRQFIDLFFAEKGMEIGNYIDFDSKQKIISYVPEAKKIWFSSMKLLSKIEDLTKTPFTLKKFDNLYALDGIVVAEELGINSKKRYSGLILFSIYYLCVHLLDDLIEDRQKFQSLFTYPKKILYSNKIEATGLSFIMNAILSISFILKREGQKNINKVINTFINSLVKQLKYFALEKNKNMKPEEILKIKQRKFSGEATSFIADALMINKFFDNKRCLYIKRALYYLGSLTQFTDDLRDYKKDKNTGNANLLIFMENFYKNKARDKFAEWYVLEENLMMKEFYKSGIQIDERVIKAIPWHPFFYRMSHSLYEK